MVPSTVDLAGAARLARGHRQREWLALLLCPGVGLAPANGTAGTGFTALSARIDGFVDTLGRAGYRIEQRPVGHRGVVRRVLTGYCERYGRAYAICRNLRRASGTMRLSGLWGVPTPDELLARLTEAQLEVLEGLVEACGGAAVDPTTLIEAARRLT
jgi:hypothetical protein